MTLEVDPDFGDLRYWAAAKNAPTGTLADRANKLWSIVQARERTYQKRVIPETIIRGMTVELAAAFARNGQAMTPEMLHLLSWVAAAPPYFLCDPLTVYSGHDGKGQGVDSELKVKAIRLDIEHIRQHGSTMPEIMLAREVGVSRKSIGNWRKQEPMYRAAIKMLLWLNKNYPQYQGGSSGKK
jgi:hypothetical protein